MRTRYEERIPLIVAVLRRLGGAATREELYHELKSDPRFGTRRRVDATLRWDRDPKRRTYDQPVFIREGRNRVALSHPAQDAGLGPASGQSRVYERGQTIVPRKIRDAMGLEEGSRLVWELHDGIAAVIAIPKDPVAASFGLLRGKGPTLEQFLADRNAERQRERDLESSEDRRWRTYSTRRRR